MPPPRAGIVLQSYTNVYILRHRYIYASAWHSDRIREFVCRYEDSEDSTVEKKRIPTLHPGVDNASLFAGFIIFISTARCWIGIRFGVSFFFSPETWLLFHIYLYSDVGKLYNVLWYMVLRCDVSLQGHRRRPASVRSGCISIRCTMGMIPVKLPRVGVVEMVSSGFLWMNVY